MVEAEKRGRRNFLSHQERRPAIVGVLQWLPAGFPYRMDAMNTDTEIQRILSNLFHSQRFAVLATDDCGQPYTSLMSFVASADLRQLVVLTDRSTCKFANLTANCRVALLIDNRENKGSDTHGSVAVTAIGKAQEISSSEGAALLELFIARHPYLAEFALSPSCAIVTVKIDSYLLVSSFQRVVEWHIKA